MRKERIADWDALEDRRPAHAVVADVDLVVVRFDDAVSVLYGRCQHRGALMADGFVRGDDIICGLHDWDYQYASGVSSYDPSERLHKFSAWIEDGSVWVDEDEIAVWETDNPQPYRRDAYQGVFQDHSKGSPAEPHVKLIQELAGNATLLYYLSEEGSHGHRAYLEKKRQVEEETNQTTDGLLDPETIRAAAENSQAAAVVESMAKTACPHCGQRYKIRDDQIGITTRCKKCSSIFKIETIPTV